MNKQASALLFSIMISGSLISCAAQDQKEAPGTPPVRRVVAGQQASTIVSQCLALNESVSVLLKRSPAANSCLSQVSSFDTSDCSGAPKETIYAGSNKRSDIPNAEYIAPLNDVNNCGEIQIRRLAGKCLQSDFSSGADGYLLCYYPQRPPMHTVPGVWCVAPYQGDCKP